MEPPEIRVPGDSTGETNTFAPVVGPAENALLGGPTDARAMVTRDEWGGCAGAVCKLCGAFTEDWFYFDGKTGYCRCNDCRRKAVPDGTA
jgi:hypothetical protein